jgi:excisionase family DNA binding protein
MLEFAPLLPLQGSHTPAPKRTLKDKILTKARLEHELTEDIAVTRGLQRTNPPARPGTSRNPNDTLAFNFVDDHFLNREAHEEAVAAVEGWRPQPWKGQIWRAVGKRNIQRVWTGPVQYDLVWNGSEWLPVAPRSAAQNTLCAVDTDFACLDMRDSPIEAIGQEEESQILKHQKRDGAADDEMNAAYVLYEEDSVRQKESFYITLSAFVRSGERTKQVNRSFNTRAEIFMNDEDIFAEFTIDLMRRIEKGQYTHEGKIQNWIGSIWGRFFFPGIKTKVQGYADRNVCVNHLDPDLDGYEQQNHAISAFQIEKEQAKHEREGYYAPISRDRIFRQLNGPTQAIVRMLCEGISRNAIAVNLDISERHLLRKLNKVVEEGGAVAQSLVLHSVQACTDDQNLPEWPEQGIDIQASAAPSENKLAAMVEAYETAITAAQLATILQCSRREIYKLIDEKRIPALRVGTMIRLDPYQIAEWIRSKMTIAA